MESQSVHIASYSNVAEAEAARMRLAMDGIPTWLSNVAILSWCWHYGIAVGGVKLFVPKDYVSHAILVLSPTATFRNEGHSVWNCPTCSAPVDSSWYYCWSCGTSKTGETDPTFHSWYESKELSETKYIENSEEEDDQNEIGRLVVRMWAASVYSLLWAPIFLFPALYFAFCIHQLKSLFRPIDRCRYRLSWISLCFTVLLLFNYRILFGDWLLVIILSTFQIFHLPLH